MLPDNRRISETLIAELIPRWNAITGELRQAVQQCIDQLSMDIQIIINLKYYYGFAYREIADMTGIKENTVKTKLHRAKQKIAKNLEKYLDTKGWRAMHNNIDSLLEEVVYDQINNMLPPPKEEVWEKIRINIIKEHRRRYLR